MTDEKHIAQAAQLLKEGKLVAFPTETVYGLGGNALSDDAVAGIYAAKQRPQFNPLIVHVRSPEQARRYVAWPEAAQRLAERFWPGPLTLVLPRLPDCALSLLVSAGLDCVAVRSPQHALAQALLAQADLPVAAPSANRSGRISPTEAAHVREELGGAVAMVLDGGACAIGIESTVLDLSGKTPVLLRPGSVTKEELEAVIGEVQLAEGSDIRAPGMLASHYAPVCPVRLNARHVKEDEALLAFGGNVPQGAAAVQNLSPASDLREAAANLFRMLRSLDSEHVSGIAVMEVPEEGLGVAINDRLRRAAAPR